MWVKCLPADLRYSQAQTVVEGNAIRLSLSDVHGFGPEQIKIIETERQRGPFRSLNDLVKRPHVEALVLSGAPSRPSQSAFSPGRTGKCVRHAPPTPRRRGIGLTVECADA
jgi:hypothetical protein